MMLSAVVLACIAPASARAAKAETSLICPYLPPEGEAAQMSEWDFTATAAIESVSKLEKMRLDGTEYVGDNGLLAEGYLRLIQGYVLKYWARSDASLYQQTHFCQWLATDGHWPE